MRRVTFLRTFSITFFLVACSPTEPLPATDPAAPAVPNTATTISSGNGWKLMSLTGTSSDRLLADERVYILQSAAALDELSLPPEIEDQLRGDWNGGTKEALHVVSARVIEAIQRSQATGQLDPYLQSIAEAGEPGSQWPGGPEQTRIRLRLCSDREPVIHLNLPSLGKGASGSRHFDVSQKVHGTFEAGVQVKTEESLQFRFLVHRVGIGRLCIPYSGRLEEAALFASIEASAGAALGIEASEHAEWESPSWELGRVKIYDTLFFIGPVPVYLGVDLPLEGGVSLDAEAEASLKLESQVSYRINYNLKCVPGRGCSGQSGTIKDDSFEPELIAEASGRLRAGPFVSVGVRAFLYDDSVFSAEGRMEVAITGDLWGYIGNGCGDGDGDGVNEDVEALTFDLDAGLRFRGLITFLNRDHTIGTTSRPSHHLWFKDLIGSSALDPMLHGPLSLAPAQTGTYQLRMRPCWPYRDSVRYALAWGDGQEIGPVAPADAWDLETHAWSAPGIYSLNLEALRDSHGRTLGRSVTREISVGCPASCDDGNPCTDDAFGAGCQCVHTTARAGTVCRAAAGPCDVAETCTGTSTACPPDALAAAGAVCRLAAGPCDAQEACDGVGALCPGDSSAPDGTGCDDGNACTRNDACSGGRCGGMAYSCTPPNPCQVAVACDGNGGCFFGDRPDGAACDDGDPCTTGDVCTGGSCGGTAGSCPGDGDLGSSLGSPVVQGTTCGAGDDFPSSCNSNGAHDRAYYWTAPYTGSFTFTTAGSGYDSVLQLYNIDQTVPLGCNDDAGGTTQSTLSRVLTAGQRVIIVVDGSGATCGTFQLGISGVALSPLPGDSMALWLRTDEGVLPSAGKIPTWLDQSGNGRNATMATAARQPALATYALNGLPVARFGGAQSLVLASLLQPSRFTLFVVGKNSNPNETFSMILGPGGSSANNQLRWENGSQALFVGTGNGMPTTVSTIGNTRVYHELSASYDGAQLSVFRDGAPLSTHSFTTSGPWDLLQVGAYYSSAFMQGDLAEVLVFNRVLTPNERGAVDTYLRRKYGLP